MHCTIICDIIKLPKCAPVAQWIRASVFGTEGRRFESYPVYHCKMGFSVRIRTVGANFIWCIIFRIGVNTKEKEEGAMHILGKIKVDRNGRLTLTKIFREMPEEIVPSCDAKSKKLFFREATRKDGPGIARKVDSKNRVSLPREFLNDLGQEYYICTESVDEHFVLPAKFLFIG